jgi:hypothetical protein
MKKTYRISKPDGKRGCIKSTIMQSFLRKQESINVCSSWMPAFAGMTKKGNLILVIQPPGSITILECNIRDVASIGKPRMPQKNITDVLLHISRTSTQLRRIFEERREYPE